jgi:hypothetical protein
MILRPPRARPEREITPLIDGALQEPFSLIPVRAVCSFPGDGRICENNPPGRFVRIEVVATLLPENGAADAALTRAVRSRQNINAWNLI